MTSNDIKIIPIKQLALSPLNVRKTEAGSAADAELKASIKADGGIKQNLLVYPKGKNKFLVHGGGRRLKQLQALIEEGALPADTAVPCKVETEEQAIISSTTENVVRANMLGSVSQLSCWVARPSWLWARITGHIKEGTWTSGSSVPAAKRGQRLRRRRHHKLVHEVQD